MLNGELAGDASKKAHMNEPGADARGFLFLSPKLTKTQPSFSLRPAMINSFPAAIWPRESELLSGSV